MEIEISKLISALGKAVSESQQVIEKQAIANYFDYFKHKQINETDNCLIADSTDVAIVRADDNGNLKMINVPFVALVPHNNINLDEVRIKMRIVPMLGHDEKILLDLGAPQAADESVRPELNEAEKSTLYNEMELTFKCNRPAEGIARLNTEIGKIL